MKKLAMPLAAWLLFAAIAVLMARITGNLFLLFNFLYIGTCLSAGVYLFDRGWKHARRFTQLAVGLYMLVLLGLVGRENMQLSGFFYYLFLGVFQAAVIHYAVAKIGGPLIFGRGWCGYACWTAMVLDLLPYKVPNHARRPRLGGLRYAVFAATLLFVASLFLLKVQNLEAIMYVTFIAGNALYYAAGIALAVRFRDNRAFCKILCPIPTLLKPLSYFALVRIRWDASKCVSCHRCTQICPMDVDMMDDRRSRRYATECILCGECARACPRKALRMGVRGPKGKGIPAASPKTPF